eukprot:scaffold7779_cov107-Skeletonema_menzelii.AAC.4
MHLTWSSSSSLRCVGINKALSALTFVDAFCMVKVIHHCLPCSRLERGHTYGTSIQYLRTASARQKKLVYLRVEEITSINVNNSTNMSRFSDNWLLDKVMFDYVHKAAPAPAAAAVSPTCLPRED